MSLFKPHNVPIVPLLKSSESPDFRTPWFKWWLDYVLYVLFVYSPKLHGSWGVTESHSHPLTQIRALILSFVYAMQSTHPRPTHRRWANCPDRQPEGQIRVCLFCIVLFCSYNVSDQFILHCKISKTPHVVHVVLFSNGHTYNPPVPPTVCWVLTHGIPGPNKHHCSLSSTYSLRSKPNAVSRWTNTQAMYFLAAQ